MQENKMNEGIKLCKNAQNKFNCYKRGTDQSLLVIVVFFVAICRNFLFLDYRYICFPKVFFIYLVSVLGNVIPIAYLE